APTTTRNSPRARPPKKPCALSSGASATPSAGGCAPTPTAPPEIPRSRVREGNRGTALTPARPALTPNTSSSAQPLPDLSPHHAPPQPHGRESAAHRPRKDAPNHLTQRGFDMGGDRARIWSVTGHT